MGFLDHSTNNIIVDAVLTDLGRRRLAANDGSFSVVKFALGDDEVNYEIISKFGLTVGREKIEKNTPVFEAQTSSSLGLKHKLISLSSQIETVLPQLVNMDESDATHSNLTIPYRSSESVNLKQKISQATSVPVDLRESVYMVRASSRFLIVKSGNVTLPAVYTTARDRMGMYRARTVGNQLRLAFSHASLSDTVYATFGDSQNNIHTNVIVTGLLTGISHNISITLLGP
jgi:hypothetical protein